jgi:hypothetical protein
MPLRKRFGCNFLQADFGPASPPIRALYEWCVIRKEQADPRDGDLRGQVRHFTITPYFVQSIRFRSKLKLSPKASLQNEKWFLPVAMGALDAPVSLDLSVIHVPWERRSGGPVGYCNNGGTGVVGGLCRSARAALSRSTTPSNL